MGISRRQIQRVEDVLFAAARPRAGERPKKEHVADGVADVREPVGEEDDDRVDPSSLRDPRRREAYDQMLEDRSGVRLRLAQVSEESRQQGENAASTPQGRQYWNLAQTDIAREDWPAATRNLQTALAFEPSNPAVRRALETAKTRIQ